MSRIARVVMTIDVHLETDSGLNTPDAYEPPYEYLVVREADHVAVETFGDPRPLELIAFDDFPDHDPDGLIHSALSSALYARRGEEKRDG